MAQRLHVIAVTFQPAEAWDGWVHLRTVAEFGPAKQQGVVLVAVRADTPGAAGLALLGDGQAIELRGQAVEVASAACVTPAAWLGLPKMPLFVMVGPAFARVSASCLGDGGGEVSA